MSVVDRCILITGASRGLGLAAAAALAKEPRLRVVLAGSPNGRGAEAAVNLRLRYENPHIVFAPLDLGCFASIRRFCAEWPQQGHPPLTAVVCNAAVQPLHQQQYSRDGIALPFAVNYLSHYLLTCLLLPQLQLPARLVYVGCPTSRSHPWLTRMLGQPEPRLRTAKALAYPERYPDFGAPRSFPEAGRQQYVVSKQCLTAFALEVARRLQSLRIGGVSVQIFDPVLLPATGLLQPANTTQRFAWNHVWPILRPLVPGSDELMAAGEALAWVTTSAAAADPSGQYWNLQTPLAEPDCWFTSEQTQELLQESARLCELSEGEDPFVNAHWITQHRHRKARGAAAGG